MDRQGYEVRARQDAQDGVRSTRYGLGRMSRTGYTAQDIFQWHSFIQSHYALSPTAPSHIHARPAAIHTPYASLPIPESSSSLSDTARRRPRLDDRLGLGACFVLLATRARFCRLGAAVASSAGWHLGQNQSPSGTCLSPAQRKWKTFPHPLSSSSPQMMWLFM